VQEGQVVERGLFRECEKPGRKDNGASNKESQPCLLSGRAGSWCFNRIYVD
jgi:hypothetical protein